MSITLFIHIRLLESWYRNQRRVDSHILRSRPSPEFSKLSLSPTIDQKVYEIKIQVQIKSKKINKLQVFNDKNYTIHFHWLSPNSVLILNLWSILQSGAIQKKFVIVRIQSKSNPVFISDRNQTTQVKSGTCLSDRFTVTTW